MNPFNVSPTKRKSETISDENKLCPAFATLSEYTMLCNALSLIPKTLK